LRQRLEEQLQEELAEELEQQFENEHVFLGPSCRQLRAARALCMA
jgi:hypothetical protein